MCLPVPHLKQSTMKTHHSMGTHNLHSQNLYFSWFWGPKVNIYIYIWVFPKIRVPQNGWFIVENPIKMDDLGVFPYFWKHLYIYIYQSPSFIYLSTNRNIIQKTHPQKKHPIIEVVALLCEGEGILEALWSLDPRRMSMIGFFNILVAKRCWQNGDVFLGKEGS